MLLASVDGSLVSFGILVSFALSSRSCVVFEHNLTMGTSNLLASSSQSITCPNHSLSARSTAVAVAVVVPIFTGTGQRAGRVNRELGQCRGLLQVKGGCNNN